MSDDDQPVRLTDDEAKTLFDRLFPRGFAGMDVLAELVPEGWAKSPLLACFRPSPAIVRAHEEVYGCEPKGWPPA